MSVYTKGRTLQAMRSSPFWMYEAIWKPALKCAARAGILLQVRGEEDAQNLVRLCIVLAHFLEAPWRGGAEPSKRGLASIGVGSYMKSSS